jgi:hypothetical protein
MIEAARAAGRVFQLGLLSPAAFVFLPGGRGAGGDVVPKHRGGAGDLDGGRE